MAGETDLSKLVPEMTPKLNLGKYVFTSVKSDQPVDLSHAICSFREEEGITLILEQNKADELGVSYDFVASWITLQIHSSLEAVGLTAVFSSALAKNGISCNVVAGYYHDHIFINHTDQTKAMDVLRELSES